MAEDEPPPGYRFDHSRMKLLDVPMRDKAGQVIGQTPQPPFNVLVSEEILRERPELQPYWVEQQPDFSVWAGGTPPPIYVSLPDRETFHSLVGDPRAEMDYLEADGLTTGPPELGSPSLSQGVFDEGIFDEAVFDTPTLDVHDATSLSEASQVTIAATSGSASGSGSALGVSEAIRVSPEFAQEVRDRLRSASWTGIETRMAALPGAVERVGKLIVELDQAVERCGLTNLEQQRAKALTGALRQLASSPQPEWQHIVQILNSPIFTALLNVKDVAYLVVGIALLLLGD